MRKEQEETRRDCSLALSCSANCSNALDPMNKLDSLFDTLVRALILLQSRVLSKPFVWDRAGWMLNLFYLINKHLLLFE